MRMLVITGDVIDMHVKGETVANMLDLIIPQLPADVFLCDDHYSGGVHLSVADVQRGWE